MKKLILITGGIKSGKSRFAESLMKDKDKKIYLATAVPFDRGMKERIKQHQINRASNSWITIELSKNFKELENSSNFRNSENILLECITLFLNNWVFDYDIDWEKIDYNLLNNLEKSIFRDINNLLDLSQNKNLIIVTNEIGLGVIPDNSLSSFFVDLQGRVNQYLASIADEVYFTISGIPMKIKGE